MNKSAVFRLKLSFPNVSGRPFIGGITSSLKPLQGLYTPKFILFSRPIAKILNL